mgnify:CR=1 FL=1
MKTMSEFKSKVSEEVKPLKSYAIKLTGDVEEAEDLLQETVLKAFTNEDKFTEGTNLKGWLYTIMRNVFINKYRRSVKSKIFHDPTENQYYLNSSPAEGPHRGEGNLVMREVNRALNELSDNLRTPFMLSYDGYKYEEIAQQLSIPLGTVKVRIHNARKELMKKLSPYRYN